MYVLQLKYLKDKYKVAVNNNLVLVYLAPAYLAT